MNYIELLNKFYDLLQETRVSGYAQLLYYTLLQVNNRCGWTDWFARTNVNLSGLMCVSEKTLINARNELKQLGLIDFSASKKRGECTKYRILNPTNSSTKEVQKKYKRSTKEVQTPDIYKPKPKQKDNKDKEFARVAEFYEANIGVMPRYVMDEVVDFLGKGFQGELITECLKIAVSNNARKWSYAKAILEDCASRGLRTLSDYIAEKEAYKRGKRANDQHSGNAPEVPERGSLGNVY